MLGVGPGIARGVVAARQPGELAALERLELGRLHQPLLGYHPAPFAAGDPHLAQPLAYLPRDHLAPIDSAPIDSCGWLHGTVTVPAGIARPLSSVRRSRIIAAKGLGFVKHGTRR